MSFMQSLFGKARSFKPAGPAPFNQPSERDRLALFWWLKRETSYTYINSGLLLWVEFCEAYERYVRSQNEPSRMTIDMLRWAKDAQFIFERGLKGLRKGDHSVFGSRGALSRMNRSMVGRPFDWEMVPPEHIEDKYGDK